MAISKVILCEDISAPDGKQCEAAKAGNLQLVKILIENGEKVNQVDGNGETPLIIASCLGYAEVGIIIQNNTEMTFWVEKLINKPVEQAATNHQKPLNEYSLKSRFNCENFAYFYIIMGSPLITIGPYEMEEININITLGQCWTPSHVSQNELFDVPPFPSWCYSCLRIIAGKKDLN